MSPPSHAIPALRCRRCEYDLAGRTDGVCTECGAEVAAALAHAAWWTDARARALRACLRCTAIALTWPFLVFMLAVLLGLLRAWDEATAPAILSFAFLILLVLWATSVGLSLPVAAATVTTRFLALTLVAAFCLSGLLLLVASLLSQTGPTILAGTLIFLFALTWFGVAAWCTGVTVFALGAHRPSRTVARSTLLLVLPCAGLLWLTAVVHFLGVVYFRAFRTRDEFVAVHVLGAVAVAALSSVTLAVIIIRLMRFLPQVSGTDRTAPQPSSTEAG
jgi:hypothetical protein